MRDKRDALEGGRVSRVVRFPWGLGGPACLSEGMCCATGRRSEGALAAPRAETPSFESRRDETR